MNFFAHLKLYVLAGFVTGAVFWPGAAFAHPWGEESREVQIQPFGPRLLWKRLADVFHYPIEDFTSPVTVFAVHSSEYWDPEGTIKTGMTRLRKYSAQKAIPFYYLVSAEERNFLLREQAGIERLTSARPFEGDAHFYRASGTIIFAGGNFSQCLCNALRASVINGSRHPMTIKLVSDAIYEIPFPTTLPPDMRTRLRPVGQDRNRLDQLMAVMTDREFMRFIRTDWIAHDQLPCAIDPPNLRWGSPGGVNLVFRREGRTMGQVGQGQDANIIFEFTNMDELSGERSTLGH